MRYIFFLITVIGLLFCLTNDVYISAVPSLLCLLLAPLILAVQRGGPRFVFWLLAFYAYALVSTALYYFPSFFNFGYYRYDGNFIISYAPLLVLPFMAMTFDLGRCVKVFLHLTTWINLPLLVIHHQLGQFGGLFQTQNAAGGFFSISATVGLFYFLQRKSPMTFAIMLLNLMFLFETYSRGSWIGLLAGFVCYWGWKTARRWVAPLLLAGAIAVTAATLAYSYPLYLRNVSVADFASRTLDDVNGVQTKSANILVRMLFDWPRGLKGFLSSPFVGIGMGAINDYPLQIEGTPGVFSTNMQPHKDFSSSHAHHSYLQFLAELGLAGTAIFLMFWRSLYLYFIRQTALPWMRDILIVTFWNVTFASFTEHRITTPATILPFFLLAGLYVARLNGLYANKKNIPIPINDPIAEGAN